MNQLPSFEPIEQLFPLWKTARPIVENTLPRALRFEITSQNALGVSLDWAQAIVDLTPLEDVQAVCERINSAWEQASAAIDMQPFSVLLNKPADQNNFRRADAILESQVQEMLAAGKPTPLQILAHLMGITPLYAMVKIKGAEASTTEFNIIDYPYPLPERDAVPTLREQFEAQALVLAVKHYRYANSETALRTLFERRTDGTYSIDWVDGAWIGYQAGRESVVVDLPYQRMHDGSMDGGKVRAAIESAGGSVKP